MGSQIEFRILVFDRQSLFAEALAGKLATETDVRIDGVVSEVGELEPFLSDGHPDVVIMDIACLGEDPFYLLRSIRRQCRRLRILVVSQCPEEVFADRCLRAGANGYVMKSAAFPVLRGAIDTLLAGEAFVGPAVGRKLVDEAAGDGAAVRRFGDVDGLSDRELYVFTLIGEGRSSSEIADAMGVGRKTVDTYKERIKKKLGLRNAVELSQAAADFLDWQV